jgi:1-phosphofructokinase family hexose kinase
MILSITLNPCIDHALFVDELKPHDSNRVVRVERDAGGKGINLSRVVAELGGTSVATGLLGGGTGNYIRHVLDQQGAVHRFLQIEGETRVNFSVEDETDQPPTSFNERGPTISAAELSEFRKLLPELVYAARWIAVGGSMPPGVPKEFYAELVGFARENGIKILVDADGEAMVHALGACPDLVKPNADEASRLLGREIDTLEQAVDAVQELRTRMEREALGTPIAIISRGDKGAVLACAEGVFNGLPPKVDVRSTIGSGDSLLGGFLWALEEGRSIEDAFRLGIACGAATATTSGSEIARRPVIEAVLPGVTVERVAGG